MPGHTGVVPVIVPGVAGVPGFTVIEMLLLDADAGEAQVAFDVKTTLTISPLVRLVVVKVALLVPAFAPFTNHW